MQTNDVSVLQCMISFPGSSELTMAILVDQEWSAMEIVRRLDRAE